MPIYIYTATNRVGEETKGTYEVESKEALAFVLRKQGLLLTSADVAGRHGTLSWDQRLNRWFERTRGVSDIDLLLFTRHLAVMVNAGLALTKSLTTLARQTENTYFGSLIEAVEQNVRRGQSLSESMGEYPDVFDEFYVSMIEVGEAGGSLVDVLHVLEHHIERIHEIKARIIGAIIYPAVIIGVMILIGIVMMVMVVPKLVEVFADLGVDLPIATRLVIGISTLLTDYALAVLGALVGLAFFARWFLRKPAVRFVVHRWLLRIPVLGGLIQKANVSRFSRNISSLLKSGVPILQGLEITARTLSNVHFRQSLLDTREAVQRGGRLHEALASYKDLYPLIVVQMVEVGEETGELSEILEQLAEFYEEEVTNATENLTAVIEPVLMVIIGAIVGFFAISMIQPMYAMLGQV